MAELINRYRIVPRLIVLSTLWLTWKLTYWFMQLPDPTGEQTAFVTGFTAGAVAFFKFYMHTPKGTAEEAGPSPNQTAS